MSNLMWRRKRELAEAWQSQSRSSSYLQMTWWLWVVLRQFWCHEHSIPVLTLEWRNEKIGFSNVKYNLGLLWVHPHVATHLVLHGVVCVLHCCCWLLVQTHHIIKRQVQVRSGGSQSWRVLIMTHLERMYLPFFFLPLLSFKAWVCGRKWIFLVINLPSLTSHSALPLHMATQELLWSVGWSAIPEAELALPDLASGRGT